MSRLIELPWDSQPQEAVLPATDLDLTALILPGISDHDLVSGIRLSTVSGTPTRIVNADGRVMQFDANQEAIFTTATAAQRSPQASVVWAGTLDNRPPGDFPALFGTTFASSNTNPFVGIEIKRRQQGIVDNIFLSSNYGGSGLIATLNSSNNYLSGPVVVIGVHQSGRQVLAIRSAIGVERVTGTQSGAIAYGSGSRIEIGDSLNARNPTASCAVAAMSSRAWSDSEIDAVLYSVWGRLLAPQQIYIPTAAAPTLPTLSLPTAIDITATSFRPRVTYAY